MSTKIEWVAEVARAIGGTAETWNPIRARHRETGKVGWFCVHASEGCRNCYAETWNAWRGNGVRFRAQDRDKVEIFLDEDVLLRPLSWRKRRAVFPCDMTDMFGDWVPDEWLDKIFAIMALTPHCIWMPLTKRAGRMRDYLNNPEVDAGAGAAFLGHPKFKFIRSFIDHREAPPAWPLPNVWCGVSAENQDQADKRIPLLLQTPAAVRFVSAEPLLGPLDLCVAGMKIDGKLDRATGEYRYLDWVIVGGESGPKARAMRSVWARQAAADCMVCGVAFFFKQWGEYAPNRDGDLVRVGRKAAGRMLDGVIHDGIPGVGL